MMSFNEINELPGWLKTSITLLLGAGGAKLLAVWLENRRLEKKEYRDTLLGRIRELEVMLQTMNTTVGDMRVELALVKDENYELREKLGMNTRSDDRQEANRRRDNPDEKPSSSL